MTKTIIAHGLSMSMNPRYRAAKGRDGIADLVPSTVTDVDARWSIYRTLVREGIERELNDAEANLAHVYFESGLSPKLAIMDIRDDVIERRRRREYAYQNGRCIECGASEGHTPDCAAVD